MNEKHGVIPEKYRDAIMAAYLRHVQIKDIPRLYDVPNRAVRNALDQLTLVNTEREKGNQEPLLQNEDRLQVYRWATKYTGASTKERQAYTLFELKECIFNIVTGKSNTKDAFEEYGISKTTYTRYVKQVCSFLNAPNVKVLKLHYKLQYIRASTIKTALNTIKFKVKGFCPHLLPVKESLIIDTAKMK